MLFNGIYYIVLNTPYTVHWLLFQSIFHLNAVSFGKVRLGMNCLRHTSSVFISLMEFLHYHVCKHHRFLSPRYFHTGYTFINFNYMAHSRLQTQVLPPHRKLTNYKFLGQANILYDVFVDDICAHVIPTWCVAQYFWNLNLITFCIKDFSNYSLASFSSGKS